MFYLLDIFPDDPLMVRLASNRYYEMQILVKEGSFTPSHLRRLARQALAHSKQYGRSTAAQPPILVTDILRPTTQVMLSSIPEEFNPVSVSHFSISEPLPSEFFSMSDFGPLPVLPPFVHSFETPSAVFTAAFQGPSY